MSSAIKAIEADRNTLLALCRDLDDWVWAKASGCPGWTVQDLVSHMACSFWLAVDPAHLPDPAGLAAERAADVYVESRRSMTPARFWPTTNSVSAKGLELLAAVGGPRHWGRAARRDCRDLSGVGRRRPAPLPLSTTCTSGSTSSQPAGPLNGEPPASDELRLAPTLEWIEAALPQQNSKLLDGMDEAVEIRLTGVSARTLRIGDAHVAVATSPAIPQHSCSGSPNGAHGNRWASTGKGDPSALEVARRLHVF